MVERSSNCTDGTDERPDCRDGQLPHVSQSWHLPGPASERCQGEQRCEKFESRRRFKKALIRYLIRLFVALGDSRDRRVRPPRPSGRDGAGSASTRRIGIGQTTTSRGSGSGWSTYVERLSLWRTRVRQHRAVLDGSGGGADRFVVSRPRKSNRPRSSPSNRTGSPLWRSATGFERYRPSRADRGCPGGDDHRRLGMDRCHGRSW